MQDLERYHQIHRAFGALNLGAAFAGLAFGSLPIDLNVILLSVLLILIRAKFWFDDEAYLADVGRDRLPAGLPFAFGMLIAVLSWIAWTFAGFYIKDVETCSLLLIVVYLTSTAWIIAAMVKQGAYAEQIPWLFFNCLYVLGFALIYLRGEAWNPFSDHHDGFATSVLAFLYLLFVADFSVTRLLEQRRRPP